MFIALKELKHGKLRFMMSGLILALISWLVFILSSLGNGLSTLSAATLKNMDTDYVAYEKGSSFRFSKSLLPEEVMIPIKKDVSVKAATPFGASMGSVLQEDAPADADKEDVAILGIEPGKFIAIISPSGSGKSTFLTIAGTLLQASKGEVIINGK